MTGARSARPTCAAPPWYISANPPRPKSSITGNRPRANTPWWTAPSNSAGCVGKSPSSTRISAFPVPARRDRSGFAQLTAEVAFGHVEIVLGLEVSRLARNNGGWYRLLDLCGMTYTLIGDADGVYHPGLFNDRLLLGLKGAMSEAELHILRARLDGGIRNKAARGELRRGLPVGFVWGEEDGEVRLHPDAAVVAAISSVFERFAELGSARRVWLWFHAEGLGFPHQPNPTGEARWSLPTYIAIHHVLTNPVYAGAYCYGKTRNERYILANWQSTKCIWALCKATSMHVGLKGSRSPQLQGN